MSLNRVMTAFALSLALIGTQQLVTTASGQAQAAQRQVKHRVSPGYPELAKRMNLTGKVRFEVLVAADGRVKFVRTIGGHPVLVHAAESALREWKFAPAPGETTEAIEMEFTGSEVH